jgi:hypothetical protein
MPTVKTQDGKVVTKDGKVSCECCIADNCLTGSAYDAISGWQEITSAQYAELYAGGTWLVSASSNLALNCMDWGGDFWTDPATGEDIIMPLPNAGTSTGSGSITLFDSGGCSPTIIGTGFGSGTFQDSLWVVSPYPTPTPWSFNATLQRRLGTKDSKRWVSFSNSSLRAINSMAAVVIATHPETTRYQTNRPVTRPLQNVAPLAYTGSFAATFGAASYALTLGVVLFDVNTEYGISGNGPTGTGPFGLYDIVDTGSMTMTAAFTLSAP